MTVQLNFSPEVFLVVYEFLCKTKLGDSNLFETAISDFMCENSPMLDDRAQQLAELLGTPELSVNFSEGMTFIVLAKNLMRDSIDGYAAGS